MQEEEHEMTEEHPLYDKSLKYGSEGIQNEDHYPTIDAEGLDGTDEDDILGDDDSFQDDESSHDGEINKGNAMIELEKPLLKKEKKEKKRSCINHPRDPNRLVMGIVIKTNKHLTNVRAHDKSLAYLSSLIKNDYKSDVATTNSDFTNREEYVCIFLMKSRSIALLNATNDGTLCELLNTAYSMYERSPFGKNINPRHPDGALKLSRVLRKRKSVVTYFGCCLPVDNRPYDNIKIVYFNNKADLKNFDKDGTLSAFCFPDTSNVSNESGGLSSNQKKHTKTTKREDQFGNDIVAYLNGTDKLS